MNKRVTKAAALAIAALCWLCGFFWALSAVLHYTFGEWWGFPSFATVLIVGLTGLAVLVMSAIWASGALD